MTARATDRYLRRGGEIAMIYPGTLRGVEAAIRDAQAASKYTRDVVHEVIAVQGGQRKVVRAFLNGKQLDATDT